MKRFQILALTLFLFVSSASAALNNTQDDLLFLKGLSAQSEQCATDIKKYRSIFSLLRSGCMDILKTDISIVEQGQMQNRYKTSKGEDRLLYERYIDVLTTNFTYIIAFIKTKELAPYDENDF